MRKLLLLMLAWAATLPAARAQTGRLAHLSHSGSLATLGYANDNLGLPNKVYKNLEIVLLNDTMVLVRGQVRYDAPGQPWRVTQELIQFRTFARDTVKRGPTSFTLTPVGIEVLPLHVIKQFYPQAKWVGFDKPWRKRGARKPAGRTQTFQRRPLQHGYWRGLATVVAVGAVGWLWGKKRPT